MTCPALAQGRLIDFDIPPQALPSALETLARQGGLKTFYPDDAVVGKETPGLSGQYTARQAVAKLLADSGLSYTFMADDAVAIKLAQADPLPEGRSEAAKPGEEAVPLPEMTVTAKPSDATSYTVPNASSATKTDTPIMETPYSIQVVPRQVLEDVQAIRPNDALDYVSGVYRANGSGDFFDVSRRRGFENFPGGDYRDGFPFQTANILFGGIDLANIERVEVLKGPASLLYGMTEPGGIVNFVIKKPLSAPYYSFQQQFGSFDLYRTTVDATGPITQDDTLLYRFNLAYKSADSFRDFVDSERVFVAPGVTWNISPRTQVNFELEYDTGHVIFDRGIPAIGNRPADLPRERFLGEAARSEFERILVGLNWSHAFNEDWTLSHRFNALYAGQDTTAHIAFGEVAPDGTIQRFGNLAFQDPGDQPVYYTSLNLTGHINTYGLDHTLLFGGDYYRHLIDRTQNFIFSSINIFDPVYLGPIAARGNPADNVPTSNDEEWFGLYFQDQIKLPYHLHMLAGFRYDSAESSSSFDGRISEIPRQDSLTPRGGLVWQPIHELSLYGSYTENFSANNGAGFDGALLPPESAQQWELGIKTELFEQRFLGTLAWFDLTKQNVPGSDPNHPGFSIPIGEARSAGLELDLKGEILPGWNLIGAYTFTPDAEITGGDTSQVGKRLNGVPRHGGSLLTTYELQSGTFQGLKFGGGVIVRSQQEADEANTAQVPGYATVNLLASYQWKVGPTQVIAQLNVDNLLDKEYFIPSFTPSGIGVGTPRAFLGAIRVEY